MERGRRSPLYVDHKSSINSISGPLSPVYNNSSEKYQVDQTKRSLINQNRIAYVGFQWSALNDRLGLVFSIDMFVHVIDWRNRWDVV